jgi:hypothetical protein
MKTVFLGLFWGLLISAVLIAVGLYMLGSENSSKPEYTINKNNFDGSYNVSYSNSACGELGYQFKLIHEKDGYSSNSKMRKSNCKTSASGVVEGYIYPDANPNLRVFWTYVAGKLDYKE